jgi:uncharacterized membrane protein
MKKIYLLLALLLFMPFGVKALTPDYNIDGLYINADIRDNGDMLVREQIVMNGSFNGYVRDLYYKGNYSLYDASALELINVCEAPQLIENNLGNVKLNCFTEDDYAMPGDSYVYTRSDYSDYTSLKMFNYTPNGTKIFYIEYLLKDVVVIHNDVAELYWTFIGENFEDDIKDVKVTVNLPSIATDLRVWAHGPLTGNIKNVNNNQIIATISDLYANNLVDIRSTFDKSIVPYGTKLSDDDALSSIVNEEKKRADEANRERALAKTAYYGLLILNGLWIVGAVLIGIYAYKKYDKEHKSTFNLEYYREFPAEYGPEVVEYLMKKNITPLALSATILNIIRKKGLEVREEVSKHNKKEYTLVKKNINNTLTNDESYIVDWLIDEIGNGNEVSLMDISHSSQSIGNAKDFMEKYNEWNKIAKTNSVKEDFYEDHLGFKVKAILYGVLGFILFTLSISTTESPFMFPTFIVSAILIIYTATFTKRTIKGNDHYVKWNAFKRFLLDFGRFNEKELPEIVLWEKYLVYATVFGIADKVSKAMEIKIRDMGMDPTMPLYTNLYLNHYFATNLVSTVNTVRTASMSKIAQSQSSSGSGFGGGFSGGGGFGGGGVGGGGHGF